MMTITLRHLVCGFLFGSVCALSACKKSGATPAATVAPLLKVNGVYAVSATSIHISGVVTNNASWTEAGIWWKAVANSDGGHYIAITTVPLQEISGTITGLTPNKTYFVGVYAKNSAGTEEAEWSLLIQTPNQ
jgi:hypothetical protein